MLSVADKETLSARAWVHNSVLGYDVDALLAECAELRRQLGVWEPPSEWKVVPAPTHEAWLDARHGYLTASDFPAVAGVSRWKSRDAVVAAKAAPRGPERSSDAMRAGQYFEDGVLRWWADEHAAALAGRRPARLRNAGGTSILVAHPNIPGLAASLDAVLLDEHGAFAGGIVEVKWTGTPAGQWDVASAACQARVQALCVGADHGFVAVSHGGGKPKSHPVKVPEGYEQKVRDAVAAFWRDVNEARAAGGSERK